MGVGHERLDVHRAAIEYVGWAYRYCEAVKGHRNAKEQLLRASQVIPLNIAEGNGKATDGDQRRYFEIARGSALECGAIQEVLEVCGAMSADENVKAKEVLDRIVAMLTRLDRRGYAVREERAEYAAARIDPDADTDSDSEGESAGRVPNNPLRQTGAAEPISRRGAPKLRACWVSEEEPCRCQRKFVSSTPFWISRARIVRPRSASASSATRTAPAAP
jgi:four helix bundle protein